MEFIQAANVYCQCCMLEVQCLAFFSTCCEGIDDGISDCLLMVQVIWGYRWLIFRIMIGAGMIKARFSSGCLCLLLSFLLLACIHTPQLSSFRRLLLVLLM